WGCRTWSSASASCKACAPIRCRSPAARATRKPWWKTSWPSGRPISNNRHRNAEHGISRRQSRTDHVLQPDRVPAAGFSRCLLPGCDGRALRPGGHRPEPDEPAAVPGAAPACLRHRRQRHIAGRSRSRTTGTGTLSMEFLVDNLAPIMFFNLIVFLLLGFPVAFSLAATGVLYGLVAIDLNLMSPLLFQALPQRVFGIVGNDTLLA